MRAVLTSAGAASAPRPPVLTWTGGVLGSAPRLSTGRAVWEEGGSGLRFASTKILVRVGEDMVACGLGCLSPASPAHGSAPGVAAPGYRRCWTRGGPAHTTRGQFQGAPQASVRFCFVLFSRTKTFKRRPCFHLRPRCVKPLAGVSGCAGRPRLPQTWPVPSVEKRVHPPCPGRGSRAPFSASGASDARSF